MRCLLLACVLLGNLAFADEILIVGNNYSPPKIYAEGDQAQGMLVDILRYADAAMPGHRLNLHLYPWARAYKMAESGQAGVIGLSWTTDRQQVFDYSEPLFYDEVVVVVRHDDKLIFNRIEDLKGRRIGLGVGGSFGDEFEQARRQGVFQVDEDNGPVSRLKKLLASRIDAALINPGNAGLQRAIALDPELSRRAAEFQVLAQPLKRDANYLGFHKRLGMGDFLAEFNRHIRRGYANGDIPRLLAPYQLP